MKERDCIKASEEVGSDSDERAEVRRKAFYYGTKAPTRV